MSATAWSSDKYVLLVVILVTSHGAYSITTNQSCEAGKCSDVVGHKSKQRKRLIDMRR